MRRRFLPLLTLAVCIGLIVTVAAAPPASFLRQTNESDGHRESEYGVFGVTLYQPSQSVPGLNVSHDFQTGLDRAGVENHPQVKSQLARATRTIRKDETQYWLRIDVKASPKEIGDFYARQFTGVHRSSAAKVDSLEGLCFDGHTRARVFADRRATSITDVLVTFSVPR
jgi:hypothetical protein